MTKRTIWVSPSVIEEIRKPKKEDPMKKGLTDDDLLRLKYGLPLEEEKNGTERTESQDKR